MNERIRVTERASMIEWASERAGTWVNDWGNVWVTERVKVSDWVHE